MAVPAALALSAMAWTVAPAAAPAAESSPFLVADTSRVGRISLYHFDVPGTRAEFLERVGDRRIRLGSAVAEPPVSVAGMPDAVTWRCDRRRRSFESRGVRPDGSEHLLRYAVLTPPCDERLGLSAPRSAPSGGLVAVRVRDLWGLGDVVPELCVKPPERPTRCRRVRLRGATSSIRTVRLAHRGRYRLSLRLGAARATRSVASGSGGSGGAPPPTLLVTGDSTVQNLDMVLAERYGRTVRVVRDWRPGSSLSLPEWRWVPTAAEQAHRHRPRVTVISLGGNEGWPLTTSDGAELPCCGARWRAEYASRVGQMMGSYARSGHGRVLWLRLPAPRDPDLQAIATAVNAAVSAAAAGREGVTAVGVDELLTPGGVFRRKMTYKGRERIIRQEDGVHLTIPGAAIVTDLLAGILGPEPFGPSEG